MFMSRNVKLYKGFFEITPSDVVLNVTEKQTLKEKQDLLHLFKHHEGWI